MTRDEIKKLFPEATDEQVSALLSSHHGGMNKLKDVVAPHFCTANCFTYRKIFSKILFSY